MWAGWQPVSLPHIQGKLCPPEGLGAQAEGGVRPPCLGKSRSVANGQPDPEAAEEAGLALREGLGTCCCSGCCC